MQEEKLVDEADKSIKGKDAAWHKRRVKRMKVMIVAVIVILLILPTVFCIFLGMKVNRLQNQVESLTSLHNEDHIGLAENETKSEGSYAYATELPNQEGLEVTPQGEIIAASIPDGQKDTASGQDLEVTESPTQNSGNTDTLGGPNKVGETVPSPIPTGGLGSVDVGQNSQGSLSGIQSPVQTGDAITADTASEDNPDGKAEDKAIGSDTTRDAQPDGTNPTPQASEEADGAKEGTADKNNDSKAEQGKDAKAEDSKKPEDGEIKIASTGIYAGKKVYLTFDDGPSVYTDEILDILDQYGVKATFFVIGKTDKKSKQLYKRIVDEGHTLGMHSYSHVYKQIYNSLEDFDKDFTKLWKLLYDTTGYMPTIYRFPGGSGNLVNKNGMDEFIRYLKDKNILYYDWNVVNGDATGEKFTKAQLIQNVLDGVASKKRSIVLMHDAQSKRTTVDALPELLEALVSQGAELLPLNEDVAPIQQIKAEEVK